MCQCTTRSSADMEKYATNDIAEIRMIAMYRILSTLALALALALANPFAVAGEVPATVPNASIIRTLAPGSDQASIAFALTGVKSRKNHGSAGTFDLPIDTTRPISGLITVEPRMTSNSHMIVFQFNSLVTESGTVRVTPSGTATTSFSGNEVIVTLTNVPDNTRVTVSLVNVNSQLDLAPISLGFLIGDVNDTHSVNASSISGLMARTGQITTGANFKFDLNTSGAINSSDISAIKARSGRSLPAEPVTILAVGDIAQCNGPAANSAAAQTAALIDQQMPGMPLLLLGDLAYYSGTTAEYQNCYEPTYGKFLARSFPAPGNHDYGVPGGDGYYTYFGARAGPDRRGYYSFDVGGWHIISLNSNIDMARDSAQETWLRADLAANSNKKCTLAYWHHPRFSSSSAHGNNQLSADVWRALYEFGADVVLVGHDHTYERFAPQDPDAVGNSAKGIRQFVIGTGGAGLYAFGTPQPNSEVRGAGAFGVAKFVLDDGKYSWEFLPIPGSTFTDVGEANCVL